MKHKMGLFAITTLSVLLCSPAHSQEPDILKKRIGVLESENKRLMDENAKLKEQLKSYKPTSTKGGWTNIDWGSSQKVVKKKHRG